MYIRHPKIVKIFCGFHYALSRCFYVLAVTPTSLLEKHFPFMFSKPSKTRHIINISDPINALANHTAHLKSLEKFTFNCRVHKC